jgi:RNA polymerase sporulation-specific sigma factor
MRLVYCLFNKLHNDGWKYQYKEDLISAGFLGLVKAVLKFDESKGFKFSSYAIRCINNGFYAFLTPRSKCSPSRNHAVSLDEPIGDFTLADTVLSYEDRSAEFILLKYDLDRFIARESPRGKRIIELRMQGVSQQKIAEEIGVSPSYISRFIKQIKQKFKEENNESVI